MTHRNRAAICAGFLVTAFLIVDGLTTGGLL